MTPKGKLISIGGAEDKGEGLEQDIIHKNNSNFIELGILNHVVEEAGGIDSKIEVITTASSIPEEVGENYIKAFGKLGCHNVGVIHIKKREDTLDEEYLNRIRNCDAVMFSGGNQLRLTTIFGGTDFINILHERYENEAFTIAGTSAGAMAMSNTMIYQGNPQTAHLKGEVKITTGLAFLQNVIIDSHFGKRGRFGRLAQAVGCNPSCIGIGLGEDTGLIITEGNSFRAVGSGCVFIIDGHNIRHSNIADIPEGSPISIEKLIVHVMVDGDKYTLSTREFHGDFISLIEEN